MYDVAKLATRLFGDDLMPSDIIGETLERSTNPIDESNAEHVGILKAAIDADGHRLLESFQNLAADPIARWVEGTFGIIPQNGRLVRSPSRSEEHTSELQSHSFIS